MGRERSTAGRARGLLACFEAEVCVAAQAVAARKEVGGGTNAVTRSRVVSPGDERVPACEVAIVQEVGFFDPRLPSHCSTLACSIPSGAKYFSIQSISGSQPSFLSSLGSSQLSDQHPQLVDFSDRKTQRKPNSRSRQDYFPLLTRNYHSQFQHPKIRPCPTTASTRKFRPKPSTVNKPRHLCSR